LDSTSQALSFLGRRAAAFAGALAALAALLAHAPVRIACLRGALAYAAVLALARGSRAVLERSLSADHVLSADRPPSAYRAPTLHGPPTLHSPEGARRVQP